MPTASALAMAVGIFAIGVNLLLTSLVCNEIAVIWNELDAEITEIRGVVTKASETLQETHRQKRHSHFALDGESTMRSARIVRRRLLKKLRNKHVPGYFPMAEEYRVDPFMRRQEKCNCQSFQNKCPVGPPGEKGQNGARGMDGPDGREGSPGVPEQNQYKHNNRPMSCAICPMGAVGLPGSVGPVGAPGPQGPAGIVGPSGKDSSVMGSIVGPPGEPGPDGPDGQIGLIGVEGAPAERVTPGVGEKGPPGPPGGMGPPGDQGNQGPPGPTTSIIGEPGRVGFPGRPGRHGAPGPVGLPGSVGERECECFVYTNEPSKRGFIPIGNDLRNYEIRRAPQAPQELPQPGNIPVASQITVQKKGELVTPVERQTLYNYTQNGLVNISLAKPPKQPVPIDYRGPLLPLWKLASTTEAPQRYRYITDKEYAAAIPANIFAKRTRVHGTSVIAPARAFAVENDLISIQKPNKIGTDDSKTVVLEKVAEEIIAKKKHHHAHGTHTFTPTRIGMPLSQANRIGGHLVRSRRKRPPPEESVKNNNKKLL